MTGFRCAHIVLYVRMTFQCQCHMRINHAGRRLLSIADNCRRGTMLARMVTPRSKRHDALAIASKQRSRLAGAQADLAVIKARKLSGELVEAAEVEREWAGVLRTVRSAVLAIPSRCAARLPHLTAADVCEIDAEVRAVLIEVGEDRS